MVPLDITSLYTNIAHNEGIQSIKEMLATHKPPNSPPHNSYIIEFLEVVLTNNLLSLMENTTMKCQELHGHQVGTLICQLIYDQI